MFEQKFKSMFWKQQPSFAFLYIKQGHFLRYLRGLRYFPVFYLLIPKVL